MPVTGPSKDFAHKVGEEEAQRIVAELCAKHKIRPDLFYSDMAKKNWPVQVAKLTEAIQEMIWIEHADSF